jgi:hypothetical protein
MSNPSRYQWESESEKEEVTRSLATRGLIPSYEEFKKTVQGYHIKLETYTQPRYIVWPYPVAVPFNRDSPDEGVQGPLEAIQWALDIHLDGGWDWLVWDRQQKIGFHIDSNSYIYAPLDAWAEERFGIASFPKRSSEQLKKIVDAAQAVLNGRESRGML